MTSLNHVQERKPVVAKMKIKESIHQKVAVLSLRGKLMGPPETTHLFRDVQELIADGVTRVVLDLGHVNWINSMGVGAIMKSYAELNKTDGELRLVGLTQKVHSVFMMTQLTRVLAIHNTIEEAVEELNET
jgi:anti-sigma B factor antagonist